MLPGTPRSRLAVAVAAAICLHLGIFGGLWLLPHPPKEETKAVRIQVSLLETKRARPVEAAPPKVAVVPPPAPAAPLAPAKRTGHRPHAQLENAQLQNAQPERAPAGGGDGSQAAQGGEPSPAPWTHDWLNAEGLHREGPPPGGVRIDLDHPGAQLGPGRPQPAPLGPVRVPTPEEARAEEQESVQQRVEGWLSETKAHERAGPGRDVSWQTLEDALGKGFAPGWDVLDSGSPTVEKGPLKGAIEAWKKQAATYGKSGNPFAGAKDGPGVPHELARDLVVLDNEARGLGGHSLEGFGGWWLGAGIGNEGSDTGFTHRLVSMVRITQRRDGSIVAIELAGSSGNLVYDKIVLKKAYALSLLHLAPPKQGLESLWAFETRFTRVPPMPIAGCALDESFLPRNCWYPLQKRSESSVHLQALY